MARYLQVWKATQPVPIRKKSSQSTHSIFFKRLNELEISPLVKIIKVLNKPIDGFMKKPRVLRWRSFILRVVILPHAYTIGMKNNEMPAIIVFKFEIDSTPLFSFNFYYLFLFSCYYSPMVVSVTPKSDIDIKI